MLGVVPPGEVMLMDGVVFACGVSGSLTSGLPSSSLFPRSKGASVRFVSGTGTGAGAGITGVGATGAAATETGATEAGAGSGLASSGGGGGVISSDARRARVNLGARVLRNEPIPAPHDAKFGLAGLATEGAGDVGFASWDVVGGVSEEVLVRSEKGRMPVDVNGGDGAAGGCGWLSESSRSALDTSTGVLEMDSELR